MEEERFGICMHPEAIHQPLLWHLLHMTVSMDVTFSGSIGQIQRMHSAHLGVNALNRSQSKPGKVPGTRANLSLRARRKRTAKHGHAPGAPVAGVCPRVLVPDHQASCLQSLHWHFLHTVTQSDAEHVRLLQESPFGQIRGMHAAHIGVIALNLSMQTGEHFFMDKMSGTRTNLSVEACQKGGMK